MTDIVSTAALAADSAVSLTQGELTWNIVAPMIINALGTIAALAYMFGVVNQKIRAIDKDLERMHLDFEHFRERGRETDKRINDIALVLNKIDTRLDMFVAIASDGGYTNLFSKKITSSLRSSAEEIGQ